jgi:hypothetical protein
MIAVETATSPEKTATDIIRHYASLYPMEDLMAELALQNIDPSIFEDTDVEKIFRLAIRNGLTDVVEYIYIWHGVEYCLDELLSRDKKLCSDASEPAVPVYHDAGASSELNLQFWNASDKKLKKSADTLIALRKYSEMRCRDKKFYYTFKSKYRYKFQT